MKPILNYLEYSPKFGDNVFVAPGAFIIGRVTLGNDSSVFFNSVLRADINEIRIGERSNIQDNCTVHLADQYPVIIGNDVTVGHNVILHACTVEDGCSIGMGAILMDGCVIGKGSIVAAGALVTKGKVYPPGSMLVGAPAKVLRETTEAEREANLKLAAKYVRVKNNYIQAGINIITTTMN